MAVREKTPNTHNKRETEERNSAVGLGAARAEVVPHVVAVLDVALEAALHQPVEGVGVDVADAAGAAGDREEGEGETRRRGGEGYVS